MAEVVVAELVDRRPADDRRGERRGPGRCRPCEAECRPRYRAGL